MCLPGGVSLTQLAALDARAETLRSQLRAALFDDAPRLEVIVFNGLRQLLEDWLTHAAVAPSYLQEILAALLFLSDETKLNGNASLALPDSPAAVDSPHYVSVSARRYCAALLLHLCFSSLFPTHRVVAALYPLLLHSNNSVDARPSENRIADGLFSSSRLKKQRIFLSALLNGLLLTRKDGVFAVIRVLLLNDRVESNATVDAAMHIAKLFMNPLGPVWIQSVDNIMVIRRDGIPFEECVQLLSPQLLRLSEQHAMINERENETEAEERATPDFLHRRETYFLSGETFEERLHLALTVILNKVLSLPSRANGEDAFRIAHRRLCLYNRHFLTPGFSSLALRGGLGNFKKKQYDTLSFSHGVLDKGECMHHESSDPRDVVSKEDVVLISLRRLATLAKGTTLGPSPRALLLTLEPIAPGLLQLVALYNSNKLPATHKGVLCVILDALWRLDAQFAEMAQILVRGVTFRATTSTFTVDSVTGCMSTCAVESTDVQGRVEGLRALAFGSTTPPGFCSALLTSAAAEAQRLLLVDAADDTAASLGKLTEEMCLELHADAVFGPQASLDSVCTTLAAVVPISSVCWEWAVRLVPRCVSPEAIRTAKSHNSNNVPFALRHSITRLQNLVHATSPAAAAALVESDETVSPTSIAASVALDAALAILDAEESGAASSTPLSPLHEAAVAKTTAECRRAVRAAESALVTHSSAALAVELRRLASLAALQTPTEETAVREGLTLVFSVLKDSDDAAAVVAAVQTAIWWSLARMDASNSAFTARLVLHALTQSATTAATPIKERLARLKVRVLDVLLGFCDYDTDGRTLRNVDDYCRLTFGCSLYHLLARLCRPPEGSVVQVATLHLIGHYAVSVYPRVSLAETCQLCVDVFRHTPYEMSKAACAAMLSHVAASLRSMSLMNALGELDVALLRDTANGMRHYSGPPSADAETDHTAVVRQHGVSILDSLRRSIVEELTETLM